MNFNDFREFYSLVKKRLDSEKDYIKFQRFQAKNVIKDIRKKVNLKGLSMLDIGCGRGGYTQEFQKAGARVVSLDIETPPYKEIFSSFVYGDATNLPFANDSFDFVFSSSLIEHLPKPILLLNEVKRVLKNNGVFYLSFPPFYSFAGGHHFKPFNIFLPERIATFLARKIYGVKSYRYNDKYGKLYIMTIRKAKSLIRKSGFKIQNIKTRFLATNFAKIPFLNELLTWHVEFYLKK